MPRPRKHLPAGARDYILTAASDAALAETKICRALGMSYRSWKRVLREDADAKALWAEALAVERDAIVGKLYDRALEGDTAAAKFLLSARHGVSESNGRDAENGRSSVTINLPGSMSAKQYAELIHVEPEALEDGSGD